MAFIDEVTIHASAGKGGDGVVRWRHEKFREFGGPSGGDGGRGGNVYARAVRDVHLLSRYRTKKKLKAANGGPGQKDSLEGENGEHLYIDVPVGSVVTNKSTNDRYELFEEGEEVLLLTGGKGGRGNESFKSSRNTTPKESTKGELGEEADFYIEVLLTADIGLVGFPNAGKSSLLNAITRASARVGDYPFTTLEPNLGELHGYILADIPGLIEGAADGKGLGHKFLRHVKRTRLIAHLVSLENEDPIAAYTDVRNELEKYDDELARKKEIIILSKVDLVPETVVQDVKEKFSKVGKETQILSVLDDDLIKSLKEYLLRNLED